jgi:hypothetical protein
LTKISRQHPLRDVAEPAAQMPVPVWPLLQRKQNLGRPPANENRADRLRLHHRSWLHSNVMSHRFEIGLARLNTGSASYELASSPLRGAIKNTGVPGVLVPQALSHRGFALARQANRGDRAVRVTSVSGFLSPLAGDGGG